LKSSALEQGIAIMPSWSGLYDGFYRDPYTGVRSTRQFQFDLTLNKLFRKVGSRNAGALLNVLLGAAAGTTATYSFSRPAVQTTFSNPSMLGGLRPIETKTTINRASTAADVTALKALFAVGGTLTRVRSNNGRDIPHSPGAFA
jgi:hypothetical protein